MMRLVFLFKRESHIPYEDHDEQNQHWQKSESGKNTRCPVFLACVRDPSCDRQRDGQDRI